MKSQPKKPVILYLITQSGWGGAQRYILDLATGLKGQFEPKIGAGQAFSPSNQDLTTLAHQAGLKTLTVRHLVRPVSPWHDLQAIWELAALYRAQQPAIVHLNSSKAGILGSLAAHLVSASQRPKIVYTAHGWVFSEPLPWLTKQLYFWLEKWTSHCKDQIIVLSPEDALIARDRLKIPDTKITQIALGITAPAFMTREKAQATIAALTKLPFNQTVNNFVTIANSYAAKGLDILLKAIATAKTSDHFYLIGAGPNDAQLKTLATKLNIVGQVHFVGAVTEAATLLHAFTGFILPSRKEGLPYVILEALYAGLPIVATRVGGLPSLAKEYSNITLVPAEDVLALAAQIKHFPTATNTAQPKSLTEELEQTTDLYHDLISAPHE